MPDGADGFCPAPRALPAMLPCLAVVALLLVAGSGCEGRPTATPAGTRDTTRLGVPAVWSDMIAVWAAEAVDSGDRLEIARHDSPRDVLDELASGGADIALVPDDPALVDLDTLHGPDLQCIRVAIISTTGKPLLLCRRLPRAGETPGADSERLIRRLQSYALSRRGQKVVRDEPGLDPLLGWDLGVERLELDNRN